MNNIDIDKKADKFFDKIKKVTGNVEYYLPQYGNLTKFYKEGYSQAVRDIKKLNKKNERTYFVPKQKKILELVSYPNRKRMPYTFFLALLNK